MAPPGELPRREIDARFGHRFRSPVSGFRLRHWRSFLLCCWLGIFGFRAFVIERYAGNLPWIDEWQATGQEILLPWSNGTLTWSALFEAHNGDHRIVATRLWEIFWYEVNGAWDPMLVMIAKAGVFAAAATLFIHLLTHGLPRWRYATAALLAALFAFPFSYHNLMWAFQSQWDFFLLGAALGWVMLTRNRPVAALGVATLTLFTLGAGPLLAASYVPFCLVAWAERRWSRRRAIGVGFVAITIAGVGMSLRGERAAPLGPPADQAEALATVLAWPHSNLVSIVDRLPESSRLVPRAVLHFPSPENSWLLRAADGLHANPGTVTALNALCTLVALAPAVTVAFLVFRRRLQGAAIWGPLGLAGLAFLAQVAAAVARSGEEGVPIRFLDLVALSVFAGIACAVWLATVFRRARLVVAIWALATVPALLATIVGTAGVIENRRAQLWVTNVRQYFPTHDRAIFHRMIAADPYWPLPYLNHDIERLMDILDDRALAPILPKSITAPNELPRPVAFAAHALAAHGLWGVLVGVGVGAWIGGRNRKPESGDRKLTIPESGDRKPETAETGTRKPDTGNPVTVRSILGKQAPRPP